MRIRSFSFRVLSIVAGLFLGALLLASCDSGADFSSLDDLSADSAPVAKVRAWYQEQTSDEALQLALGHDADSLSLVRFFLDKYSPYWDSTVPVTMEDGRRTIVTRLGSQSDITSSDSDTSFSVVRTFVVQLDAKGNIERGDLVSFSNAKKEPMNAAFSEYARKWLSGDGFGDEPMFVFQRTLLYKSLGSWMYASDSVSFKIELSSVKRPIPAITLAKYNSPNDVSDVNDTCYYSCEFVPGGTVCWPGYACWDYPAYWDCELMCFETVGGGGGGSGSGGGGGGGSGGGNGEDECDSDVPNDEDCDGHDDSCNSTQIALAEEHESYGNSLAYPCQEFSTSYAYLIPQTNRDGSSTVGYESKHGGYGLVSGDLIWMYGQAASYLAAKSIYESAWRVNSGYRCPDGNSRVPNSHFRSRHMCGHAADLGSNTGTSWTPQFAEDMAADMRALLSTSLSHTKGTYVHIDTDTCPVDSWSF